LGQIFKKEKWVEAIIVYVIVIVNIGFFIFPVFQFFLTSIKPTKYLLRSIIPPALTLENYRSILLSKEFTQPLLNSVFIASFSTLIVINVAILAAYSLAKFNFRSRENIAFLILSLYILPPIVTAIPIWRITQGLGLLDNHLFLSLVYSFFNLPLSVWLLRSFFITIPQEIEESALIDGCSRLGTLYRITLPLALPGVVAASVFSFIFSWNEFLFATILTETNAKTVTVAIASQVSYFIEWGRLASMTTLSIVPVLVLTIFVQRYIIAGLTFGAVKG